MSENKTQAPVAVPEGWHIFMEGDTAKIASPSTGPGVIVVAKESVGHAQRMLFSLCEAMLAASPPTEQPAAGEAVPPIERDAQMQRDYIPLPGGWELQTKGNGSTLRLLDKKAGERHPLMEPQHVADFIERMAREIHAAWSATQPAEPTPEQRPAEGS